MAAVLIEVDQLSQELYIDLPTTIGRTFKIGGNSSNSAEVDIWINALSFLRGSFHIEYIHNNKRESIDINPNPIYHEAEHLYHFPKNTDGIPYGGKRLYFKVPTYIEHPLQNEETITINHYMYRHPSRIRLINDEGITVHNPQIKDLSKTSLKIYITDPITGKAIIQL